MAPHYKLTYFPIQGLAEPIRYMLAYNNIEFEDVRVTKEDFVKHHKNSAPFGKVPVLEVDGKKLHQSGPICKYLAKKVNLLGKNDWDALQIETIIDTISDFRVPLAGYFYDSDPVSKEGKRATVQNEVTPYYLSRLDKIVQENGGYFVNGQLTLADIYFASIYEYLDEMSGIQSVKKYPHLKALVEKVEEIPQIKRWIKKRIVQYKRD